LRKGRRKKNYDTKGKACGVGGLIFISWFLEGFGDGQRGKGKFRKKEGKKKDTTIC